MKLTLFCATLAVALGAPAVAAAAPAGRVSFLEGMAFRQKDGKGPKIALAKDGEIDEHDLLSTGARSRVEIVLADKSVMRLGPVSAAQVQVAAFKDDGRRFSARLILGRIWAKVTTALGGDNKFEVTTERAVAGVRGTTFRVDAHEDKAVLVRVYAGAVAVAGSRFPIPEHREATGAPSPRHQVAGPEQVSKSEWEKIVGAQMQLQVAADGKPEEPTRFAEADDCKDPWSRWNHQRDGEPCPASGN